MIWPDEDDDAARQLQKKLEYAKDLDLQIELRRAIQREEQQEFKEFERKFQPDERSPAKWLIEGGYTSPGMQHPEFAKYRSPSRFPQRQQQASSWPHQGYDMNAAQDNGRPTSSPSPPRPASSAAAAGEPSGALSVERDNGNPHTRFRITDLHDKGDRLRERAQQMEWKRVLDEQVRENARIKAQEEQERRRNEADSAREEMAFLRDEQLRAQRKMGYPVTSQTSPDSYTLRQRQYERMEDMDTTDQHTPDHRQRYEPVLNNNSYPYNEPQWSENPYYNAGNIAMPPPAPSRVGFPTSNAQSNREEAGQPQHYDSFGESRSHIISEYRSLLSEIRREREDLRQEKEDIRKEKEELRLERALLQLENEKMTNLVETQRRLNEQHMELQRQETFRQQQSAHSMMASPSRDYSAPPSVQRPPRPQAFELSQIHGMERSIAALGFGARSGRETRAVEPKPSPISMDDFAVPRNRLTPNVVDSPRFKRLSQFRFRPDPEDESNALDQSLVGESVFVALDPDEVASASKGPPRITETMSPRRGGKVENANRNELRNSRVIKSRGFYNIEKELEELPVHDAAERPTPERKKKATANKSPSRMPRTMEKSRLQERPARAFQAYEASSKVVPSSPSPSAAGAESHALDLSAARSHHPRDNTHRSDSGGDDDDDDESALSSSLFQVKVLV